MQTKFGGNSELYLFYFSCFWFMSFFYLFYYFVIMFLKSMSICIFNQHGQFYEQPL